MSQTNRDYYESLRPIAEFLLENKNKGDFVLNCFYQQDNFDLEEMSKAEGSVPHAQKFELRMQCRKEQVEMIKAELANFKNDKFKSKVAEFIQWTNYVLNPPNLFEVPKYPSELKGYLSSLRKYESDLVIIAGDVNRKFKLMSLSRGLPAP